MTSVLCRHDAELHELVSDLIPDLIDGLLTPLREAVRRAYESLEVQRHQSASAISTWPMGDIVPVRLLPAPNEFLLEEPATYPKVLESLIKRTVPAENVSLSRRGAELQVLSGADELGSEHQQLISATRGWVPRDNRLLASFGSIPQHASFEIATKPDQILRRAEGWLRKDGTAVGKYMSQGLREYLSPDDVSPADHAARIAKFKDKLISSLNASAPLVKVNPSVLVNVHGVDSISYTSHFGEIPLPAGSPAREAVRTVLESRGEWREEMNKSFADGNGGFIDVFTHLNAAYEPVVFDSLMKPIASDWGQKSSSADRRAEFWRWRRARPLTEFVPVSGTTLKLMVKGWFVAGRLKHLDLTQGTIWVPETATAAGFMASFPSVLLREEGIRSAEGIAVALESMLLALIEVNTRESIKPFAAYERLWTLGKEQSSGFGARPINGELEDWILDGRNTFDEAPRSPGTPEARQTEVLKELVDVRARYRSHFQAIFEKQKEPINLLPTWDLRKVIESSLTELKQTVEAIEPERDGGGWA